MYEFIKNKPAAKFYYRGTHERPVQRTVLITETNKDVFKGYELRAGSEVRDIENAPFKSYTKDEIATADQLRSDSALRKKLQPGESTLTRMSMRQLEEVGV